MRRTRTDHRLPLARLSAFTAAIAAGGLLVAAAPTTVTAAGQEDYEWEPDEGLHEEEWYDPSDWMDDDWDDEVVTVDYEYDATAYQAYWDGYYDGYYDDAFGYDYWDDAWSAEYRSAYTDGYYDGWYDQTYDYDYDPVYYVYSWEVDDYDRDRDRDEMRSRGDRAKDDSEASSREKREAAEKAKDMRRIRGTVKRITQVEPKEKASDHVVLRMRMEDGSSVIADFGPEMSRKDMPVEAGDRVTIVGDRMTRGDRQVLVVHRIVHDGETYTLRDGGDGDAMAYGG